MLILTTAGPLLPVAVCCTHEHAHPILGAVILRYVLSHPGELAKLLGGELDWVGERAAIVGRTRLRALSARIYAALLSCTTSA